LSNTIIFHLEQKAKYADDPFRPENFYYNEQHDCFYCPMGQKMAKVDVEAVIGNIVGLLSIAHNMAKMIN
jgi:hypothetical protein